MPSGSIRLGLSRTDVTLEKDEIAELQAQFRERHFVHLRGLLAPALLTVLTPHLDGATFRPATYEEVGSDLRMTTNGALEALHLAANDSTFLRAVETLTGCRPLRVFAGRIYRMVPEAGHKTDWHNDLLGDRLIGMTINLSRHPYEGGRFQLRHPGRDGLLGEVHNTGAGDAVVFRIARNLEHRVTDVTGTTAKTAFAGWFRPGPGLQESSGS